MPGQQKEEKKKKRTSKPTVDSDPELPCADRAEVLGVLVAGLERLGPDSGGIAPACARHREAEVGAHPAVYFIVFC